MVYFTFIHKPAVSEKDQYASEEALMDAVQNGDLEACEEAVDDGAFLPMGPKYINKPGKKAAIHTAAQYGQNDILEWLLVEKLCPVDYPDYSMMRPLHYAAMKGRTMTCKILLKMKADPTQQDTAKYSCMHFAASG